MFHLLDKFYQTTKDDCLGSLLSGFNPYLFEGSMSADPAAWGDWNNSVKKITKRDSLTSCEAFEATYGFIVFHQEEFGFDLSWVIEKMQTMSADSDDWKSSIKNVIDK